MSYVKICGITSVDDAKLALDAGANAIGMVFAKSPRQVNMKTAAKIVKAAGPWVATVGVFVNEAPEVVIRTAAECGLTAVQLHGEEDSSYTKRLAAFKVIKAFRVGDSFDWKRLKPYHSDAFLFDTLVEGLFGGTGRTFAWEILKERKFDRPFIVAGGLNPKNVAKLVRTLHPYGVDVSSGVEKAPGKKDPKLVKEFIKNAQAV